MKPVPLICSAYKPKGGSSGAFCRRGRAPGTASLLVHLDGDVTWAVLFNRGREPEGNGLAGAW